MPYLHILTREGRVWILISGMPYLHILTGEGS